MQPCLTRSFVPPLHCWLPNPASIEGILLSLQAITVCGIASHGCRDLMTVVVKNTLLVHQRGDKMPRCSLRGGMHMHSLIQSGLRIAKPPFFTLCKSSSRYFPSISWASMPMSAGQKYFRMQTSSGWKNAAVSGTTRETYFHSAYKQKTKPAYAVCGYCTAILAKV